MRPPSRRLASISASAAMLFAPLTSSAASAADGLDHAQGQGALHPAGQLEQTFEFDASSDPDGSNATGTFRWNEGPYEYEGTVECLTVSANKAVIGGRITSRPAETPAHLAQVTVFYVEDNGAAGDVFINTGIGGTASPDQVSHPDCTLYGYVGYALSSGEVSIVDEAVPYEPAPTPEGTDVAVSPPDTGTGTTPLTIAFDHVGVAGATSLTISTTGPTVPSGFTLGDPPTYYDLSTTAEFIGGATVCISYSGISFTGDETSLRMLHYENGAWVDITDGINTDIQLICGRTTSFSPFVLGIQASPPYPWTGFVAPVDNLPTVNTVKAGSAVPVKFGLGGDRGLAIFASGSPSSRLANCDTSALLDPIETTVSTAGSTSLTYNATTGTYAFVWKTDKSWAGTCRQLKLELADGSIHYASFKLR